MSLVIAIVESRSNGRWSYCPKAAVGILRPEYDDEAPFATAEDAIAAAKRDMTIPRGATFEQVSP